MQRKITVFWIITIVFVIVKLVIHFLTSTTYELHRDEMLYFAQGLHPAFGYISTPPFIGFLSLIIQSTFGYSEFGIKLFPAIAGAGSILIVALFVKELGGRNLALIIACTGYLTSGAFLRSSSLFMPVIFDQFFWFLSVHLIFKMIKRNKPEWWIWIGLVFGIGFLNKYSIVFLIAAVLLALLISKHRKIILSKYFLYGILAGIAVVSPNLFWQYNHNWPVVHHMVALQKTQLINVTVSGFLTDQFMNCLPALFIWLSGLIFLLFFRKEKEYRFISWTFIFVIIIILLGRGKSYYALGAYPMLIVAGGYALEKYLIRKLVYINYFLLLFAFSVTIIALPLELPVANYSTLKEYCDPDSGVPQRWEDGVVHSIPQDYADMTGWKELTNLVADAYAQLDETGKKTCLIFSENYGQAGAIQFYGHGLGLPTPVSLHDSYLLWAPDTVTNGPVIYINHEIGDADELFNSCRTIGRINNEYFRENGLMVFLCTSPKDQYKTFYANKVEETKMNYRR